MVDDTTSGCLVQVWVSMTDEDGSTRLESRWTSAAVAVTHAA